MADEYLEIGERAQAAVLRTVAERLNRSALVLEKDIWLCWALRAIFRMPNAPTMAFKGGTSLSKVYEVIDRFSEDVDITIDYASLMPAFDPFDTGQSNSDRTRKCLSLTDMVIERVRQQIAPHISEQMGRESARAGRVEIEDDGESVRIYYPSALEPSEKNTYLQSSVLVEFGGRNTTLPTETHRISPYVVGHTIDLFFPTPEVSVLAGERTFWEKATLIHVECLRGDFEARVDRKSRHWYDLAKLADHAIGTRALTMRELFENVVRHKSVFFASAQAQYDQCLTGNLRLIPDAAHRVALERDYRAMAQGGMFANEPMPIDEVLDRLETLQNHINALAHSTSDRDPI